MAYFSLNLSDITDKMSVEFKNEANLFWHAICLNEDVMLRHCRVN